MCRFPRLAKSVLHECNDSYYTVPRMQPFDSMFKFQRMLIRKFGSKSSESFHRFPGKLRIKEKFAIKPHGVSLFRAFNDDLQLALHSLTNREGEFLKCMELGSNTAIPNITITHTHDFKKLGQHYLAVPNKIFDLEKMEGIAMATYPEGAWSPCPFYPPNMPGGPPINAEKVPGAYGGEKIDTFEGKRVFYIPESRGDFMQLIAHVYLRRLTENVTQDMDDRRWAMIYLFELFDLEWEKDVPKLPHAHHIVSLMHRAIAADCGDLLRGGAHDAGQLLSLTDHWLDVVNGREGGLTNLDVAMEREQLLFPLPLAD